MFNNNTKAGALLTRVLESAHSTAVGLRSAAPAARVSEQPNLERKYVFAAGQGELLGAWLSAILIPDPTFSVGCVTSLYFDTPAWDFYDQKRNSDFLKTKVRLRWYEGAVEEWESVPCFMEVKKKVGALRTKLRARVEFPRRVLNHSLFTDAAVRDAPVLADPSFQGQPLVPLVQVQYERRRFIDPITGARVALDTGIRCLKANPAFLPQTGPVLLSVGVLETKGVDRRLPSTLAPLARHFRREAFSKYAVCCEQLMQPRGRRM
jgi:hypothetical protein